MCIQLLPQYECFEGCEQCILALALFCVDGGFVLFPNLTWLLTFANFLCTHVFCLSFGYGVFVCTVLPHSTLTTFSGLDCRLDEPLDEGLGAGGTGFG